MANACIGVVTRAMEIAGGRGFYQSGGLERLFRDVQAARYHPLPEKQQQQFLGEYLLEKPGVWPEAARRHDDAAHAVSAGTPVQAVASGRGR